MMHRLVAYTTTGLLACLVSACSGAGPEGEKPPAPPSDAGAHDAAHDAGHDAADAAHTDAGHIDAGHDAGHTDAAAPHDSGAIVDTGTAPQPECEWGGAPGDCLSTSACAAITDHSSYSATTCATGTECCIVTPNVLDNPPFPAGYVLMQQSQVTADMTTWAVDILHDPVTYPMFATTTQTFGTQFVLARVQWHPPDFQNSVVHRGVTLFVPM